MFTLDQNIWRSSITLETKLRLYNTCILPIFLYGAETMVIQESRKHVCATVTINYRDAAYIYIVK